MVNQIIYDDIFQSLRTGDIILFNSESPGIYGYFDSWLKFLTQTQYTHIGIIIKERKLGFKKLDPNTTYLWESGYENNPDPTDGKQKFGVRLTDLKKMMHTFKGKLWVRRLDCNDLESQRLFNPDILSKLQAQVYGKPYDINIIDWLGAFCRVDYRPQKVDRFWCSAFVGFILTQTKILDSHTDWSILRPSDFSKEDNDIHLKYQSNVTFEKKQYLLFSSY